MIAFIPSSHIPVPPAVTRLAGGDRVRPVWQNQLGGQTFELTGPQSRRFLKFAPAGTGIDFSPEAGRLRWAGAFTPVPRVLDLGSDANGNWLVTAALPGDNAVCARWLREPRIAAAAIGRGLRALHDRLPVQDCPFSWTGSDRLEQVRAAGPHDPSAGHPEFEHLSPAGALALLIDPPPIERLVVCHGDACAPNTLIGPDGECTGHVDLGALGVGDRWADLAIATWSLDWNYGPGFQPELLRAYGVPADPVRMFYYRLLWDLSP